MLSTGSSDDDFVLNFVTIVIWASAQAVVTVLLLFCYCFVALIAILWLLTKGRKERSRLKKSGMKAANCILSFVFGIESFANLNIVELSEPALVSLAKTRSLLPILLDHF